MKLCKLCKKKGKDKMKMVKGNHYKITELWGGSKQGQNLFGKVKSLKNKGKFKLNCKMESIKQNKKRI